MKTVIATIKVFRYDEVKEALNKRGFTRFTTTEVKQFDGQRHAVLYRGVEHIVPREPMTEVKLTVEDDKVGEAVQAILSTARTGRPGDGTIAVIDTEEFWNIENSVNEAETVDNAAA